MATFTHTAPIGIEQINSTFYVWGASGTGFATIQAAVDYIRIYESGVGEIQVCHGHGYGEDISTITGGNASIVIIDQRDGTNQRYHWNGTQFVPLDFHQLGNIATAGQMHSATLAVDAAALVVGPLHAYGGLDTEIIYVGETPAVAGAKVLVIGTNPTANQIQLTGETIGGAFNQDILINPSGANVEIGSVGSITTVKGNLNINGNIGSPIHAYGGIDTEVIVVGEIPGDTAGNKVVWIGTNPTTNQTHIQAETRPGIYDQEFNINPNGGDVGIASAGANTTIYGTALISGGLAAYGGIDTEVIVIGQTPGSTAGNKVVWIGTNPTTNQVLIQGETRPGIYDQTLLLNDAGGDVQIGPSKVLVTAGGSVHAIRGKFSGAVRMLNGTEPTGSVNIWTGDGDIGAPGAKGMAITAVAAQNLIGLQGLTIGATVGSDTYDQVISLNAGGGDVLVNGSRVRTFANTPSGGGMIYPGAGIGISTGTGWGTSIDPATLQGKLTLTTTGSSGPSTLTGNILNIPQYAGSGGGMIYPGAGIGISTGTGWGTSIDPATLATYPPTGIPQSTGSAWGASINPATLQGKLTLTTTGSSGPSTLVGNALNIPQYTAPPQVYPGAGVPVSTGSAWGTSIAQANIPLLNASNSFTGATQTVVALTASGNVSSASHLIAPGFTAYAATAKESPGNVTMLRTNLTTSATYLSAPGAGGLFLNYDTGTGGIQFGNGAGTVTGLFTAGGDFTVASNFIGLTGLIAGAASANVANAFRVTTAAGVANIDSFGPNASTLGQFQFRELKSDGTGSITALAINSGSATLLGSFTAGGDVIVGAGQMLLRSNATDSYIDAIGCTSHNLYINYQISSAPTAGVIVKGNFTVTGGTKAFMIPHPLDETKDLYHACLEGPENGVFYRGEVVTANGTAEVTLPDYFEALTYTEDRSVLLTQVFEDGAVLTMLAASRVVGGKFTVHSSAPIAAVAWEVKAVRKIGVDKLEVKQNKLAPATFENAAAQAVEEATQEEHKNERKQRNPKRV